ncbi:MAG TPA: polyprenol monophosphomannose synthase [Phycisphaerae bacterium]|nr:polyprenol monophosphomannose synthase [Phycisphaerae bacterium]
MMAQLSVVVPTYHEVLNLPLLADELRKTLGASNIRYELILVDDNSRDGTEELCTKLLKEGHPIRLIVRKTERGLASAVIRGLNEANGEVLTVMDADLSHPAAALPKMLRLLEESNTELIIGSRYIKGGSTDVEWSLFRRLNSKVATLLAWPLCAGVTDPMAGFFMLHRATLQRAAKLNPIGYKILLEIICKARISHISEVPIHFRDRKLGQSKLDLREQFSYLRHLYRLYMFKLFSRRKIHND